MTTKFDFEFIHDELYGTALEVSKRFISRHTTRPVLNYAQHKENGDLIATDSHRLIQVKEIHGFKEEFLVSPNTFMFAKGKFPDISNIADLDEHKKSITLNVEQIKLWYQTMKSVNNIMRMMKDHSKSVRFVFGDDSVSVEIPSQKMFIHLPTNEYERLDDLERVTFNVEYLRDALEAHMKLGSEEVDIYFRGQLRPFALEGKRVKTIILPMRTY